MNTTTTTTTTTTATTPAKTAGKTTAATDVPPAGEFTSAWIAYAFFALGVFMWWPYLLGLVICYSKHDAPRAGFVASHHRWLIRTFWWSLAGFFVGIGVVLSGTWPIVSEVARGAMHGHTTAEVKIDLNWSSIFTTASAAMLGVLVIFMSWLWTIYRIVRGGVQLADARAVP